MPGEEPSPLQRVLAVADSGNGISAVMSWDEWLFINPELTVHVLRPPEGEWVVLDAATTIAPGGAGARPQRALRRDRPGRLRRPVAARRAAPAAADPASCSA